MPPSRANCDRPMVSAFPEPGLLLNQAYRELDTAVNGTAEEKDALGDLSRLARPWDPPTCTNVGLRKELWTWLGEVVTWLNREYVWDVDGDVPACWPRHPDLVHEVAVLADQRRCAGAEFTSDALEHWHRVCLPEFVERMQARTKTHCEEGHQPWPARGRHARHIAEPSSRDRTAAYDADTASLGSDPPEEKPPAGLHAVPDAGNSDGGAS